MLRTANQDEVRSLRDGIEAKFKRVGSREVARSLTDPSGGLGDRQLFWRPGDEIWAYLGSRVFSRSRWFCWFGSDIGDGSTPLTPSVEINLSIHGARAAAGRALVDDEGKLYLAHKGMLGGGRGGQMSMADFGALIRGFSREPILSKDGKEENVFIIGSPDDSDFIRRLSAFVAECDRLRAIARSGARPIRATNQRHGRQATSRENELDGVGYAGERNTFVIRRIHGRVVNALHDELKKKLGRKVEKPVQSNMRPDLCLMHPRGGIVAVFEAKAASNPQSWFEAIGQLATYGALDHPKPARVLVCPSKLRNPHFEEALRDLDIAVLTYLHDGKMVSFDNLEEILAWIDGRRRRAHRA